MIKTFLQIHLKTMNNSFFVSFFDFMFKPASFTD